MKFKFGSFVTDGKGKLGGQVVSKNARGNYLKTKVSASNPQSPRQLAVRANFLNITKAWSLLSEENRRQWIIASESYPQKDRIGTTFYLSGFGLFTQVNMVRLNLTQSMLSLPGSGPVFPQWDIVDIQCFSLSSGIWLFFNPIIPAGYRLQVYATDLVSVGLNRAHGIYKLIGYVSTGQTYPFNLYSLWNGIFNKSLQSGKRIIFKLALVHVDSGFISQFSVFNSDIVAGYPTSLFTSFSSLGTQFGSTRIYGLNYLGSNVVVGVGFNNNWLLRSSDNGNSFSQVIQFTGFTSANGGISPAPGISLIAFSVSSTIQRSIDYGLTWSPILLPVDSGSPWDFCQDSLGVVYCCTLTPGKIFRSLDNGATWELLFTLPVAANFSRIACSDENILYCMVSGTNVLYVSYDRGFNWSVLYDFPVSNAFASIRCLPHGIILVGTGNTAQIYRSIDRGKTFSSGSVIAGVNAVRELLTFGDSQVIALTGTTFRAFKSSDYGLTWSDLGQLFTQAACYSATKAANNRIVSGSGNNGYIIQLNP